MSQPSNKARPRSIQRAESMYKRRRLIDWTREGYTGGCTAYVQGFRDHDWTKTSLGAMQGWPVCLRQEIISAMANREARLILWESEQTVLHNEAFATLAASSESEAQDHVIGKPFGTALPHLWNQLSPQVELALYEGQSSSVTQMQLTLYRRGCPEDTYWHVNFLPILGEDGFARGVVGEFTDCSSAVVGERRLALTHKLRAETARARDLDGIWTTMAKLLEEDSDDIPFALLYSVGEDSEQKSSQSRPSLQQTPSYLSRVLGSSLCTLKAAIRVPEESKAAYKSFSFDDSDHPYADAFREASSTRSIIHLSESNQQRMFPEPFKHILYNHAPGDPSPDVIILALPPITGPGVHGFLIVGLNPRTPFCHDYEQLFRLTGDVLSNAITSISLPEEHRRVIVAAEDAALRHASLLRQLALTTREVEHSEARFTRMAQHAPLGMFILRPDQTAAYLNDSFKEIVGMHDAEGQPITRGSAGQTWWEPFCHPEDVQATHDALNIVTQEKKSHTFEHRLLKPWEASDKISGTPMTGDTWLSVILYPELNADGALESVLGWAHDISLQKWTQSSQARRLQEALEAERQKEQYIDRTSHEIRNPLSAMLQSTEVIMDALKERQNTIEPAPAENVMFAKESVDSISEATESLLLCIEHQRRIVDDVLTLSKLDSKLLRLASEPMNPKVLAQQNLRMFDSGLKEAQIDARIFLDASFDKFQASEVYLDSSRVKQILINLVTNAIKFTKDGTAKRIDIGLSASSTRPLSEDGLFDPRTFGAPLAKTASDMEEGTLFVMFEVRDTGIGLTQEKMDKLFQRFQQGSVRTYEKYGGSGLGLAISKELAELHGGKVGVSSNMGNGSTFSFYIKTTKGVDASGSPISPVTRNAGSQSRKHELPLRVCTSLGSKDRPSAPFNRESSRPAPPSREELEKLHILIVEDNILNQKLLAKQLRKIGCNVEVADNGLEAINYVEKTIYSSNNSESSPTQDKLPLSVILMDVHMPVLDGLAATDRIRTMERDGSLRGRVPIIAVTANAREAQMQEALEHGMDSVVTKPFSIPDVLAEMKRVIAIPERTGTK